MSDLDDKIVLCKSIQMENLYDRVIKRVVLGVGVIFGVLLVGILITAPGRSEAQKAAVQPAAAETSVNSLPDTAANQKPFTAFYACQKLMEPRLLAPATAKWPTSDEATIIFNPSKNRWSVTTYVDSQNQYGALVRTNFTARLTYEGGNHWTLAEVNLNP